MDDADNRLLIDGGRRFKAEVSARWRQNSTTGVEGAIGALPHVRQPAWRQQSQEPQQPGRSAARVTYSLRNLKQNVQAEVERMEATGAALREPAWDSGEWEGHCPYATFAIS